MKTKLADEIQGYWNNVLKKRIKVYNQYKSLLSAGLKVYQWSIDISFLHDILTAYGYYKQFGGKEVYPDYEIEVLGPGINCDKLFEGEQIDGLI